MADKQMKGGAVADRPATRDGAAPFSSERLIDLLNEDLAREYQAIIAYVVYSQVLKGAQYMSIAKELEKVDGSLHLSPGIGWIMGHGHGHGKENAAAHAQGAAGTSS